MLGWKEGFGPGESSTFNVDTRAEQEKSQIISTAAGLVFMETQWWAQNNEDILVAAKLSFCVVATC